ncbi:MAG: spondin domain-containing protein, partial [Bacteroidota bacterium]
MKNQHFFFLALLFIAVLIVSCSEEEAVLPGVPTRTTSFQVTLTNTINLLSAKVFNTPDGANNPGPIATEGGSYSIQFKAQPGARLNFVSMLANTNDWFFALGQNGYALFEGGNPQTGDITDAVRLYDAGTEEEDPSTIATEPNGGTAGTPDDDTSVRTEQTDVRNYLSANLFYANGYFTLKLTKGVDGVLTPGLIVIHAQDAPLFTRGEADRGQGLKLIAEAGDPSELYGYLTETGPDGAPLRLAAAISPLSPAVVYAFGSETDPLFTQGEAAKAGSGLEEIAEDGNNQVIYDYLKAQGLPVAQSNETTPVGPGGSLTFNLEIPEGYRLGIATMLVQTNDWFISFNNSGAEIFDATGNPSTGTGESVQLYLYDSGTETDEPVGTGIYQAPRQAGPDAGDVDP